MLFLVQPKSKSRRIEKDRPIRLWIGLLAICCVFLLFGNTATRNVSQVSPLDGQLEYAAITGNVPALIEIWTSHQNSPAQIADVRSHLNCALRAAVSAPNIKAARLLLQWGADPNAPSPANKTAISIAVSNHDSALIILLKNPPASSHFQSQISNFKSLVSGQKVNRDNWLRFPDGRFVFLISKKPQFPRGFLNFAAFRVFTISFGLLTVSMP